MIHEDFCNKNQRQVLSSDLMALFFVIALHLKCHYHLLGIYYYFSFKGSDFFQVRLLKVGNVRRVAGRSILCEYWTLAC